MRRGSSWPLWCLRGALLAALGLCVLVGSRHWAGGVGEVIRCIEQPTPSCQGRALEVYRWFAVVGRTERGWRLELDGHRVETASALPGAQAGDNIEAVVRVLRPGAVRIEDHIVIDAGLLRLRVVVSLAASLVLALLFVRRAWRRHRAARRA